MLGIAWHRPGILLRYFRRKLQETTFIFDELDKGAALRWLYVSSGASSFDARSSVLNWISIRRLWRPIQSRDAIFFFLACAEVSLPKNFLAEGTKPPWYSTSIITAMSFSLNKHKGLNTCSQKQPRTCTFIGCLTVRWNIGSPQWDQARPECIHVQNNALSVRISISNPYRYTLMPTPFVFPCVVG